jgi:hypothetical protein
VYNHSITRAINIRWGGEEGDIKNTFIIRDETNFVVDPVGI